LLLEIGLRLTKLFLGGGDQAEVMLGVLIIIFRCDRVAGTLRVARELKIFLGDMGRGPADFYVLPIGLVHSRQRILMMATLTVTTAHTFILTVSHGLLFRNPLTGGGTDAAASLHRISFKVRHIQIGRSQCAPYCPAPHGYEPP
jgi:hypothetical protein